MIPKMLKHTRKPDGTLKVPMSTARFNRKWGVIMQHNSIKEQAQFFGHSENISDLTLHASFGAHPLCSPLAKSSRYVFFEKDFPAADEDILSLPNQSKNREYVEFMNRSYVETVEKLTEFILGHRFTRELLDYLGQTNIVEKETDKWVMQETRIREGKAPSADEIASQRAEILKGLTGEELKIAVRTFVLDYARVYLIAAVKTSLGYSVNGRTLGDLITTLISNPRKEDQERGNSVWREAKKIAPVILGSEGTLGVDEWQLKAHTELRDWMEKRFPMLMEPKKPKGPIKLITSLNIHTDRFNAAAAVFPYVNASLEEIYESLTKEDITEALGQVHAHRRRGQGLSPSICHSGLLVESTLPWHAFRDILRHRRGARSRQLLSTRLGYSTPELFVIAGLDDRYKEAMEKASVVYEEARKHSPHIAEKLVPWGYVCRSLQSWHINQIAYVISLRSRIKVGHATYVDFARKLWDEMIKIYPETAKYIEGDRSDYPAELWKRGYEWWDIEGKYSDA
jgi:thymidylate synthase ThyX